MSEDGDGDADEAKRKSNSMAQSSYEDGSETEEDEETDDDDNDNDKKSKSKSAGRSDEDNSDAEADAVQANGGPSASHKPVSARRRADIRERVSEIQTALEGASKVVTAFRSDKTGRWVEVDLQFGSKAEKLLLINVVERTCRMSVVHAIPGIQRIMIQSPQPGTTVSNTLAAEGINFQGIWGLRRRCDRLRQAVHERHWRAAAYVRRGSGSGDHYERDEGDLRHVRHCGVDAASVPDCRLPDGHWWLQAVQLLRYRRRTLSASSRRATR